MKDADMDEMIGRLRDARVVLNKNRIVTRDMGHCEHCDGSMSTGSAPQMCHTCALETVDKVLAYLDSGAQLSDEEEKVVQAMRDYAPSTVEMLQSTGLRVWKRRIVKGGSRA